MLDTPRPFIPIVPRHREDINTEAKYNAWLSTVKDGDRVLIQEFHPKKEGFDIDLELWYFTMAEVEGNRLITVGINDQPFNIKTGKCCYWGQPDSDWGNVFPARMIPITRFKSIVPNLGDKFIGDRPLYEPLFTHKNRHVLKIESRRVAYAQNDISKVYPYNYLYTSCGYRETLMYVFTEEQWERSFDDVTYLYSEYLRD